MCRGQNGLSWLCFQSATDATVKTINSYLNQPFHREKGLLLLLAFVSQSSIEALSNNAISWMINCNKIIHQTGSVTKSLALKVLGKLVDYQHDFFFKI